MDDYKAACAAALVTAAKNRKAFADKYCCDTQNWMLERDDIRFLERIRTDPLSGRALFSNAHVQRRAQEALIAATVEARRLHPDRKWVWITITSDHGITFEREPYIDYVSLRGTFEHHLRRCGLHGFGVVELDTWKNLTGEDGRRMVPHAHFLGYRADGAKVGVRKLEQELCDRRALKNSLGARGAVVLNVKPSPENFARIGRYQFKCPTYAKMLRPETEVRRGRLSPVGHAQGSVARLIEIQSRIEVGDVMFSIGGGRAIAEHVRRAVADEVRERRGATEAPSRDEVARHWRRIRLTNGQSNMREPTIITRKEDRKPK